MTTMMPFAKKWGVAGGIVFSVLSIMTYDFLTQTFGVWSLVTAGTYGAVAFFTGVFLKKRDPSVKNWLFCAIVGTLFFDAVTGIGMGMLLFHQTLVGTLVGQIPFTLYHLAGNLVFAVILSPLVYRFVINNIRLEFNLFSAKVNEV